jgi:hypothetical protein
MPLLGNMLAHPMPCGVDADGMDVFVAGSAVDHANRAHRIAMLWKNGTPTWPTDGNGCAEAEALAVAGADTYVAGYEVLGQHKVATVWRNGTPIRLSDGRAEACAVALAVDGEEVYVAGSEQAAGTEAEPRAYAMVWRGRGGAFQGVRLTDGSGFAEATCLCVSGPGPASAKPGGLRQAVRKVRTTPPGRPF